MKCQGRGVQARMKKRRKGARGGWPRSLGDMTSIRIEWSACRGLKDFFLLVFTFNKKLREYRGNSGKWEGKESY